MAYRVDIGSLRPPEILPDGRMRCDGALTRTGVFTYRNADGSERREYRPPEEVFDEGSLSSFAMVPVTNDHPTTMVTADNAKDLSVGMVGENLRRDEQFVIAPMMLFDAAAIADVKGGKTQLSCGYRADVEMTPGVSPDGERYDAIQRNIRGNHLAIVDVGRAGPGAAIRMDAGDCAIMVANSVDIQQKDCPPMEKELKAALEEVAQLKADCNKLTSERDEQAARADKAEGERDAAVQQVEQSETARKDAVDSIDARVAERVELERTALFIMDSGDGEAISFAGKSDREVKEAAAIAIHGDAVNFDGKADAYVDAYFHMAAEKKGKEKEAHGALRADLAASRTSQQADAVEAARQRMVQRHADACKKVS